MHVCDIWALCRTQFGIAPLWFWTLQLDLTLHVYTRTVMMVWPIVLFLSLVVEIAADHEGSEDEKDSAKSHHRRSVETGE